MPTRSFEAWAAWAALVMVDLENVLNSSMNWSGTLYRYELVGEGVFGISPFRERSFGENTWCRTKSLWCQTHRTASSRCIILGTKHFGITVWIFQVVEFLSEGNEQLD